MTVEHAWTWEKRERRDRRHGGFDVYEQHRLVCACGFVTQWRRDAYIAKSQADRHALDGQRQLW